MTRSLLLDTHALLWAALEPAKLGSAARKAIQGSTTLLLSAASLWEIAILASLGRISMSLSIEDLAAACRENLGVALVAIEPAHLDALAALPFHHRDPFDRLLVAQARSLGAAIVSKDRALDAYGIERIWS
jgi:PIN domain nuclease of toxin-antitoxin system